jgi:isopentenyl-diphosphate Delta-isomerase
MEFFDRRQKTPQGGAIGAAAVFPLAFSLQHLGFLPMSDEIFDVVNDRDEVIGQRLRFEVHRDGEKHRAIHVLVFNSRGEVFLQKRSMSKDTFPGVWDSSASGHLDCGEDYDACAVREVREELGLTLKGLPQRVFKLEACAQTGQEFVWVYRGEEEGPFVLHPEEIERGEWFEPEHVSRWVAERPEDFASAFVLIWEKLGTRGTHPSSS